MKEIREILKEYEQCLAARKKAVLASVVHVDGSSYRRPGARMLVEDDGRMTGAISGGCLEGDALRKAMLALQQQQSKLVIYDTSDEEDMKVGVQLGCAGVIRVLFEPIDQKNEINPLDLLKKAISKRQKSVVVTLFSIQEKIKPQTGTCLLMEEDGSLTGEIPFPEIKEAVMADAKHVMESGNSIFRNYIIESSTVSAFIEYIGPPVSLVVAGAGNDAIPLVNLAASIGWEITVADGRNTHAKPDRFQQANRVIVGKPDQIMQQVTVDKQTVFVLMTHNYNYDLAMLKELLNHDVCYIGILGPKNKLDRMLKELGEEGIELSEKKRASIFSPVGLEIGAETAEEIAVSIIAEIKTVLTGKSGLSLRDNKDVIHSREETQFREIKLKA